MKKNLPCQGASGGLAHQQQGPRWFRKKKQKKKKKKQDKRTWGRMVRTRANERHKFANRTKTCPCPPFHQFSLFLLSFHVKKNQRMPREGSASSGESHLHRSTGMRAMSWPRQHKRTTGCSCCLARHTLRRAACPAAFGGSVHSTVTLSKGKMKFITSQTNQPNQPANQPTSQPASQPASQPFLFSSFSLFYYLLSFFLSFFFFFLTCRRLSGSLRRGRCVLRGQRPQTRP